MDEIKRRWESNQSNGIHLVLDLFLLKVTFLVKQEPLFNELGSNSLEHHQENRSKRKETNEFRLTANPKRN